MAVFKCKMCGGALEIAEGATVAECAFCGTKQTVPRLTDEKRTNLYDRANHFRRIGDYDKAMALYEQILAEDATDAEAYWSISSAVTASSMSRTRRPISASPPCTAHSILPSSRTRTISVCNLIIATLA